MGETKTAIEPKPMNIYQKLQKCRVGLQKKAMKKSGKNTFSHYEYFELGDFLPQINELMFENGLTAIFDYATENATLTIIDTDKIDDTIKFETPVVASELKGCMPMQSVGAMQTYARRYLYVMAFEISENDIVNIAEVDEEAELRKKKIDPIKAKVIKDLITKSNSDEKGFCTWAKIARVERVRVAEAKAVADKAAKLERERLAKEAEIEKARLAEEEKNRIASIEKIEPQNEETQWVGLGGVPVHPVLNEHLNKTIETVHEECVAKMETIIEEPKKEPVKEVEPLYYIEMRVVATMESVQALSKFLKDNSYNYTKLKGGKIE